MKDRTKIMRYIPCKNCNKYFASYIKLIDKGEGLYCSRECYTESKKGHVAWNKGIPRTPELKEKLSKLNLGRKPSIESRKKMSKSRSGNKNWNWKGGITPKLNKARNCIEYDLWKETIFKKYKNRCQICGLTYKKGYLIELHAHHIESFNDNKDLRYDTNNGIVLCAGCHNDFHNKYKKGNNNLHQLLKFMEYKIDLDYKFNPNNIVFIKINY